MEAKVKKLDQQALFEKGYIASPASPAPSTSPAPPVSPASPAPLCETGMERVEDVTQDMPVATQDAFETGAAPTAHTLTPDAIQSIQRSQGSARVTVGTQGTRGELATVEAQKPRPVQKIHTLSTQDLKTGRPTSRENRDRRNQNRRSSGQRQRIRVASYCRVSTWHEVQVESVRAQEAHYRRVINANPEWELAGIYIEIGVTGTRADIRPQLQALLAECRRGRVDLILVKSISRFARNVTDALQMIRELTSMGVVIRFEEEKINTGTAVSEFMIAIMSVFAEEESHSISGNIKWGIRQRFREGAYKPARELYGYSIPRGTGAPTLGGTLGNSNPAVGESVENGRPDTSGPVDNDTSDAGERLTILHDEATVVREVYGMVLSGIGTELIAESLNRRRIRTRDGFEWTAARVADLIRNPTYRGDRLYQRTYKDENFRQRKNLGNLPWYYDEGCHIGIVSREVYDAAQGVVAQHRLENGSARLEEDGERAGKIYTRYGFSGRLYCRHCGAVMRRKTTSRYSSYACVTKRQPSCVTATGSTADVKAGRNVDTSDGKPGSTAGDERVVHPTVRVQEDSIKAAFLTVLNKLAYSEKQRKQHRVVSRYIEMIDACDHPQPGSTGSGGTVSVGNSEAGERGEAEKLESELNTVRREAARLAATVQAEGFSARSIELSNELKDREQRIIREMERVDIRHSVTGIHSDTASDEREAATELKSFIRKWTPTSDLADFRDRDFLRFVDKAVIGRIKSTGDTDTGGQDETQEAGEASYTITFHFTCGLILTEEVGA